jgi:hypothetical protein
MTALARLIIRVSVLFAARPDRARFREEWLGELAVVAARGGAAALRFALGAPRDAWSMREQQRLASAIGADFSYACRQLLRRPGHTFAVVACLIVGLVASVATLSLLTSILYGDMPGIAERRGLLRVYFSYDRAAGYETMPDGKRVIAEPPSFTDFAIARDLTAVPAFDIIGAEGDLHMTAAGNHGPV